jgi:hypothetical protein
MSTEHSELWHYVRGHLGGRSMRWLALNIDKNEPTSAGSLRNWLDGITPFPEFRADQIAAALNLDSADFRARAGLEPDDTNERKELPKASPQSEGGSNFQSQAAVIERGVGELSGRPIIEVSIAALGLYVRSTLDEGEDRADVIAKIMAGIGLEGTATSAAIGLPIPDAEPRQGRRVGDHPDDVGSVPGAGAKPTS